MFIRKDKSNLNFLFDLGEYVGDYKIVNLQLSKDQRILILCISQVPERIDGMFVQAKTRNLYNYRIIDFFKDDIRCLNLHEQNYYYHYIQSIDVNNYLLVGARCMYYSNDKQDFNAKVIDVDCNTITEFVLGDGIQDVYVDRNNDIWTTYFDEGIYGNYGWENPIGSCGIICWDNLGNEKYRFNDKHISDCYALNICGNGDLWFYYYTDFELGRISKDGHIDYFKPDISGSDGFLVSNKHILFRGGYNDHNNYYLYERSENNKLKLFKKFKLHADNKEVATPMFSCRGAYMVQLIEGKIYDFELE